jgi:hypothetical protein
MARVLAALLAMPMPPLAGGSIPVTPVVKGNPVALVRMPLEGVPNAPPLTTKAPAVPTATPKAVATLVPSPDTPVEIGKPVAFVKVPLLGVPSAPPLTTNAPAEPVFTPRAVTTPVPVVTVLGAAPAPPPTIKALAVNAALVAHVDALEKYGIPPLVPATVRANVPEVVIGEPPTEIIPPVKLWATLDTVPEDDAFEANSLTVPALFLKYSFSSKVLSANSPATRLVLTGTADAVEL